MQIDGGTLISWGFQPGHWFKDGISVANQMRSSGASDDAIFAHLQTLVTVEIGLRTNTLTYAVFLDPETEAERANLVAVNAHMDGLMRVPTIVAGAVMPDACPSGSQEGTIPVGGAIAAKDAIHPGMHSADICCSMALTLLNRDVGAGTVLDAAMEVTHFGPGGREKMIQPPADLMRRISENAFLKDLGGMALGHYASQGDGNHFFYVGRLRSTGQVAIVTHHGSRGLGAQLYKAGMAVARRHTAIVAPKVASHNAWIPASSREGEAYWQALQLVREWTRESHFTIHDLVARKIGNAVVDRFWNEHNFVFQKSDGLFYHGKGATPSWAGFSADDDGRTLIPLNMSEPILVAAHTDKREALGFAPHGAGRNFGRKAYLREQGEGVLEQELADLRTRGLDIRSYCGIPDHSELPSAYKNAKAVTAQIEKYGLARITDRIEPLGSIMAGEWDKDAPWKKGKPKR